MAAATIPQQQQPAQPQQGVHQYLLMLALGIVGIIMLFGALTSAYLVKRGSASWVDIQLPRMFWYTTGIIIASSITLNWSLQNFKKTKYNAYKLGIVITFILGVVFLIGQYAGWMEMRNSGYYIDGTPMASFLYVISAVHGVHILGGIIALLFLLINALRKSYNPDSEIRIRVATVYWHFVDILWICLFILFQLKI